MKRKQKKIKNNNQASFYFEDYLETNKRIKFSKNINSLQDRIYLIFFFFISLILILALKLHIYRLATHHLINKILIQNFP